MYLIMGILWLSAGIALMSWEWYTGNSRLRIRGTEISASWLLPLLALYNFVRWWTARSFRAGQRQLEIDRAARLREIRSRDRPAEYDPNLDFTKPAGPPPGPAGQITDQPPPPPHGLTDQPPRPSP